MSANFPTAGTCSLHPNSESVRRPVLDDRMRATGKWYEACAKCSEESNERLRAMFPEFDGQEINPFYRRKR